MPDLYPPQPSPVTERTPAGPTVTRPWLLFFQEVIQAIANLQASVLAILGWGVWTDYTPVWTSTGVAPAIGDGTLTGAYCIVNGVCHYKINLVSGATTAFGTGVYLFSLPLPGVTAFSTTPAGNALLFSGGLFYGGVVRHQAASAITLVFGQGVAQFGPGTPIALANPVQWGVAGEYRLA